jgi:hypothetical protein
MSIERWQKPAGSRTDYPGLKARGGLGMKDRAKKLFLTAAVLSIAAFLFAACPGGKGMVAGIGSSTTEAADSSLPPESRGFDVRNGKDDFSGSAAEGGDLNELGIRLAQDLHTSADEISLVVRPTQFDFAAQAGWETLLYRFMKGPVGRIVSAEVYERGSGSTRIRASYSFDGSGDSGIAIRRGTPVAGIDAEMPILSRLRSTGSQARLSGSMERIIASGEEGVLEFSSPEPGQYRERYDPISGAGSMAEREGTELWKGRYFLDQGTPAELRGRYILRPAGEDQGLPMGMGAADTVTGFAKDADGMWIWRTEGPEPIQEGIIVGLQRALDASMTVRLENIALMDFVLGPNNGLRPLLALASGAAMVR